MKLPDIDYGKANTVLRYLSGAARLYVLKDDARMRVTSQLSKLKRITGKNVEGQLQKLEKDIAHTLHTEKELEAHQDAHDKYHAELRRKITALEKKLNNTLATKIQRETRIAELEAKIKTGTRSRFQQIAILKLDIAKAEHLANELRQVGTDTQLEKIHDKIDLLRARLRRLEETI